VPWATSFFIVSVPGAQHAVEFRKRDSAARSTIGGNSSNLSLSSQTVGQYSVAMSFFEMALKIREESLGERHMDTGLLYNNIGACYDMLNR